MVGKEAAVVASISQEAKGVVSLQLRRETGMPFPRWEPGAHLALMLPNGMMRQYSLCGPLDELDVMTIAVLREPESRGGSAYFHEEVQVGDFLPAFELRNNFTLEPAPAYVFVAGGIGITPLIPMIERAESLGIPWRLVYGGRSRESMAYLPELQRYGDRIALRPTDEVGILDFAMDVTKDLTPGTAAVYACGPGQMLTALTGHCRDQGVELHVEHFRADEHPVRGAGQDTAFVCELGRTGRTVEVGPDETIIQALEREGIFTRSDCREGTCGSCETAVLAGTVEHRDVLLSDAEREANGTMMICISRATCPRLVIDL